MAVSSWNGLASRTTFKSPTVISPSVLAAAFLPASLKTTSRTFLERSARVRISSRRRRYSPSMLLVRTISLSNVLAIAVADSYSFSSMTMDLPPKGKIKRVKEFSYPHSNKEVLSGLSVVGYGHVTMNDGNLVPEAATIVNSYLVPAEKA